MTRTNENGRRAGYTPIFDEIVAEYGLTTAAIFSVIWRHAQMRDGYCHASVETMATLIGLSTRAVQYRLRLLEDAGLIERISAAYRWTPHGYRVTYVPECSGGTGLPSDKTVQQPLRKETDSACSVERREPVDRRPAPLPAPADTHRNGDADSPVSPAVLVEEMYGLRRAGKALQGGRLFSGDVALLRLAAERYGATAVLAALSRAEIMGIRNVADAIDRAFDGQAQNCNLESFRDAPRAPLRV